MRFSGREVGSLGREPVVVGMALPHVVLSGYGLIHAGEVSNL
jgi:hypothetical protein